MCHETTTDFDKALRQLAASGPAGERAINAVGLEAGPALRALLNQGMGALDGLTDSLRNAQGSAEAVARTMADNLQGSLTGLGSVWDAVVTGASKGIGAEIAKRFALFHQPRNRLHRLRPAGEPIAWRLR